MGNHLQKYKVKIKHGFSKKSLFLQINKETTILNQSPRRDKIIRGFFALWGNNVGDLATLGRGGSRVVRYEKV